MIKKTGLALGVLVVVLLLSAGCTVEDLTNVSTTPTPGATQTLGVTETPGVTMSPGATATPGATQTPGANQTPGAQQSIVEVLQGEEQFSTLLFAVEAANLTDTLSEGGPFTVFAPTDDAFDQVPNETLDSVLADEESLNTLLLNHVVEGEHTEDELIDMENVTTLGGETITISSGLLGGMTLNDNVSVSDTFNASNGIIYAIDQVLIPEGLQSGGNITTGNTTRGNATGGTTSGVAVGVVRTNTTADNVTVERGAGGVVVVTRNQTNISERRRASTGFF